LAQLPWSDFVLREQIGAGASGRVYRALQRSTGQEVAVKFLRKSLRDNPAAVERFLREALTVSRLNHPGIVAVHGAGRTPGGGFFLLMDLVQGCDLEKVARREAIEPQQAAAWVAEAARAVHAAHEQGVIHCDLKPGNLLLDAGRRIRVTDFGLAVPILHDHTDSLPAGTPAFMAPEQADPRWGAISPRTDVYGLGAVLHFLLFLQPPYAATSVAEVLSRVAGPEPVPVPDLPNDSRLREIVGKALCKPPVDRFASAAELAEVLERL
jgi:serine/threonine protein kinase